MTREIERLVYGLTTVQLGWSTARIKRIINDKGFHKKARNHFYAELKRRQSDKK